jgi:hypothetical protein
MNVYPVRTNLDQFGTAADVSGSLLAATHELLLVTIIKLRASACSAVRSWPCCACGSRAGPPRCISFQHVQMG